MRSWISLRLSLALVILLHLDWHLARGHELGGFGWRGHWALAVPAFALAAGYVARRWPSRTWEASAANLLLAVFGAEVLVPLGQAAAGGLGLAPLLDGARWDVFAQSAAAGLLAWICVMAWMQREQLPDAAAARRRTPAAVQPAAATLADRAPAPAAPR